MSLCFVETGRIYFIHASLRLSHKQQLVCREGPQRVKNVTNVAQTISPSVHRNHKTLAGQDWRSYNWIVTRVKTPAALQVSWLAIHSNVAISSLAFSDPSKFCMCRQMNAPSREVCSN